MNIWLKRDWFDCSKFVLIFAKCVVQSITFKPVIVFPSRCTRNAIDAHICRTTGTIGSKQVLRWYSHHYR